MKRASAGWVAEALPAAVKLATGVAASGLVALAAYVWSGQALFAGLGRPIAAAMLAHGVDDGRVGWRSDGGWTWRRARLSGTADAATRAAVLAEVRAVPGIADAEWIETR